MHIEATARLAVFLQVTLERPFLGGDFVVLEDVVARPVQVAPRVEECVHILVHRGHVVRFSPVILDAEQQVKGPDGERQDKKPC